MSPFTFRLPNHSGKESLKNILKTQMNFCRRMCSRASPTCLSDKHLHGGGGRALPDDVVARHDNLVASKFLQLCQNKKRRLYFFFRISAKLLVQSDMRQFTHV